MYIKLEANLNAIVLTGTGFDEINPQNNIVKLGDVNCSCTATATQLTCSPGRNVFGIYNFTVNVVGKGLAILEVNPAVTIELTVSSISPLSSGTGGEYRNYFNLWFNVWTIIELNAI